MPLLASATFFEGYDSFVLAYVLAQVLSTFGVSAGLGGLLGAIGRTGSVLAFLLAAQADRFGRRRLLLVTVTGYTAATILTAASPDVATFAAAQFLAQVFLGAEYATALTIVAEEFPRRRRGRAIGILTSMGTLGGVTVGLLGFAGLQHVPVLGWRALYLVGILPLIVVAIARRRMRETRLFAQSRRGRAAPRVLRDLLEPWKTGLRGRIVAVGVISFFRMVAASAAIFWFAYYAEKEAGVSQGLTGLAIALGGITGTLGYVVAGRVMDRYGRRGTLIAYQAVGGAFGAWVFQASSIELLIPVLVVAIFFGLGGGAVTGAMATELFPTAVRGRSAAWARNAFEIPGAILGPWLVGFLGDHQTGAIGSIGDAASLVIVLASVPVLLVTLRVPETRAVDLGEQEPAGDGLPGVMAREATRGQPRGRSTR